MTQHRQARQVNPNVLVAGIVASLVIGLAALVLSVYQVEDRATAKATRASLCRFIVILVPDTRKVPPPETERGRQLIATYRAEYARLECEPISGPLPPE